MSDCYHCDLPVPPNSNFTLLIAGNEESFCCPGCQAVTSIIHEGGLSQYYKFRTEKSTRPDIQKESFKAFDDLTIQSEFVKDLSGNQAQASLLLEGISCAACVWLIEKYMSAVDGVVKVSVSAATHRCLITWDKNHVQLSAIMLHLTSIGYKPIPATHDRQLELQTREKRQALMRLSLAGFGMMQVMMVAVILYAGADDSWTRFFRWLSLIIATPVVLFSARPFFRAALSAIKTRHLVMDVPVSLAIGFAYLASVWATLTGRGEVYFESVSMFTFFLLLGRYLEMRARHRNGIESNRMAQLLPLTTQVLQKSTGEWIYAPVKALNVNDHVLISAGSTVPCDGIIIEGQGGIAEALLTGESAEVYKEMGDRVIAGTVNGSNVLTVQVTAVGTKTQLSAIESLVDQAQQEKPQQVTVADYLAGYFVAAVLVVAVVVFVSWWNIDSSKAFWVTLSVLVVTCPCALSLAVPTALTSAIGWLRNHGLLITRGHVLEVLPNITHVIFDKTGTLTKGQPKINRILMADGSEITQANKEWYLSICAALEEGSSHPIARAFISFSVGSIKASCVRQTLGSGVEGVINSVEYKLGGPIFSCPDHVLPTLKCPEVTGKWLLLANDMKALMWIQIADSIRPEAEYTIKELSRLGLSLELLSGDNEIEVSSVAKEIGLKNYRSSMSPDDKLKYVQALQAEGKKVLMIGDGINDVPVLSGADVSMAMSGATDLAQTRADSILLDNNLTVLLKAFSCAELTTKIIKQNLSWAVSYNILALPLAAMAFIPPYAAAAGMSLSSLIVVANALRISKKEPDAVQAGL